jgi:uncharacterized protein (DUF1330 family)
MPKAYLVVTYRSIKDKEKWSAYAKLAVPAIQNAGGKATSAHASPAYQEALRALGNGAERDMRLVEGLA